MGNWRLAFGFLGISIRALMMHAEETSQPCNEILVASERDRSRWFGVPCPL